MKIGTILPVLTLFLLSVLAAGVVAEENETGSGWYEQGLQALEEENYEEAISCFLEAVNEDPQNELAYSKLGGYYLMTGDVESEINSFQYILKLHSEMN